MRDVLSNDAVPEDHIDKKPGLLPRIKKLSKLSEKRNSKGQPKKYKYNLEVTPAERLFGSVPPLQKSFSHNEIRSNGGPPYEENGGNNDIVSGYRPSTRLDHYKDVQPISINVNLENRKYQHTEDSSRPSAPKSSHHVIVPSPPPSSLLLQVAPDQNQFSSSFGYDPNGNGPYNASKDIPQSYNTVMYADIDHHSQQTKGSLISFLFIDLSLLLYFRPNL